MTLPIPVWQPDQPYNELPHLPPVVELEAVEETSKWTTAKISAIRDLADVTVEYVKKQLPKIYTRELVDVIFEQPYCRIANLVDKNIAKRQAASRYLKDLVRTGVLREIEVGKEKIFIHPKLMRLVTQDNNIIVPYAVQLN